MFSKIVVIAACLFGFAQAGALAGYGAGVGYGAGLSYGAGLGYGAGHDGYGGLGYTGAPATSYVHRIDYNTRHGYGAGYAGYGTGYAGYGAAYGGYGVGYGAGYGSGVYGGHSGW